MKNYRAYAVWPNGNFEGYKARVMVLQGEHEFAAALDLARKLNQRIPDDVLTRGLIADACMELGDYSQAETQTQWMLNLRPGNVAGQAGTTGTTFLRNASMTMTSIAARLCSFSRLTS